MKSWILHIMLFALCGCVCASAADSFDRHYLVTTKSGLSNSSVNHMMHDRNGMLWISTWDGINVYNGQSMTVHRSDPNDPATILDNIVWSVIQEDDRYYWAVTDWGVSRYDSRTGRFSRFKLGSDSGNSMSGGNISLAVSAAKDVFCASIGWGVAYYDKENDRMTPFNVNGLSTSEIAGLYCVGEGQLHANLKDGSVLSIHYMTEPDGNVDAAVTGTVIDASEGIYHSSCSDDHIYYVGKERAFMWDKANESLAGCIDFALPVSYSSESPQGTLYVITGRKDVHELDFSSGDIQLVPHMCRDNLLSFHFGPENLTWLAVDGVGVEACYKDESRLKKVCNSDIFGSANGSVTGMLQSDDGDIYAGTLGNGMFVLDSTGVFKKSINENILPSNQIFSLCKGEDNSIFVGSPDRIDVYNIDKGRAYNLIHFNQNPQIVAYYQYFDSVRNVLWVATIGNGLIGLELGKSPDGYKVLSTRTLNHIKGDEESLGSGNVMHLTPRDSDHLWVSTLGGGLSLLDVNTGKSLCYRADGKNGDINNNNVRYILQDDDGSIWVGTSYGICHGVPDEDGIMSFKGYGSKEGLADNTIHSIMKDKAGYLWLSTNGGLSRFDPRSCTFVNYNGLDNLQSEEFYIHSCMTSSSGEMFFGGVSGLNHFLPEEMRLRDYAPRIILDYLTVRLDNVKLVKGGESVTLEHDENFFNIGFSALEYINNSNCEYAYILEGFNEDWVKCNGGAATFTNVPPGTYVFRVRSTNGDKVWCDNEETLKIQIRRPWYLTYWAFLLYIVMLVGFFTVFRYQVKDKERQKHLLDLEVLEKQTQRDTYEAKLNFFTNIAHEFGTPLTLIACSSERLSASYANKSKEGRYVRIINDNVTRMQTLIQELLEFRKVETGYYEPRYGKVDPVRLMKSIMDNFYEMGQRHGITANMSMPDSLADFVCDPSALEKIMTNLVSNAYKYTPDGGVVDILIEEKDKGIRCEVTNTSKGLSQEKLSHVFDRFVILDTFERQIGKGNLVRNGLGTALVNSLVKTLGGSISVDSVMDKSVTFEFFLPSAPEDRITVSSASSAAIMNTIQDWSADVTAEADAVSGQTFDEPDKPLIMIVDDDLQICSLVADILSQSYRVEKAGDGREALEKVRKECPDLIITDVDMPEINGLELIKRLKEDEMTRFIPVIFLAFKTDVASEVSAYNLGSEAFIQKPFLPQQLTAVVGGVLKNRMSLKGYYKSAMSEMEVFQGKTMNTKEKEFLTTLIQIIEQNITDDISPASVAEKLCISEMTLYRRIKELAGKRPSEFIRGIKLSRAAHLLKTTDMTVQEIMFDCGFNNKSYFYRTFSATYGMSPKEYRKAL